MSKKTAKGRFIVIVALTIVGLLACFVSFPIPFTNYNFIGFWGGIKENRLGIDLNGGIVAVYEASPDDGISVNSTTYKNQLNGTRTRLLDKLSNAGYPEATVQIQGTKIRIEVPSVDDPEIILDAVGSPAKLFFSMNADGSDPQLTSSDIKAVSYYYTSSYEHAVKIEFTTAGASKFAALTSANVGSTMYIFKNNEDSYFSAPKINEAITTGSTIISGSMSTKAEAEAFVAQLESGLYQINLKPLESSIIPPSLGEGALTAALVAGIVGLLFIFALMYFIYGHLGLIANLSMLIYTILLLFALAVIPGIQLTLPGVAGIILSIGMAVDANIIIFERIKDEHKLGKRLAPAIEGGFKRSFMTIFDSNITTAIICIVLWIFGTGSIQAFAKILLIGVALSMFCALVLTRSFCKTYLYINATKPEKLRLPKIREVAINETK